MVGAAAATSLASPCHRLRLPPPPLLPTPFSTLQSLAPPPNTNSLLSLKAARSQRRQLWLPTARKEGSLWSSQLRASSADDPSTKSSERWLLESVGDGDSRHIGYKVPLPGSYEIVSDVVTVGRVPEKASLVIPVATVSGLHARLEKKEGTLLVTDLDSTNGTYIGEKKLRPGAVTTVAPGSYITFGDIHLAMFRVSKLEGDFASEATDEAEMVSVESGN